MPNAMNFLIRFGKLLALLCILAIASCSSQDVDPDTECPPTTSHPLTIVVVDSSEAMTPRQRDLVSLLISRTWERLPSQAELRVYSLDGRAAEVLPELRICRQARRNPLDSNRSREYEKYSAREKQLSEKVLSVVSALTNGKGVGDEALGSRIYEFINTVNNHTQGDYSSRHLYLVSDMRQYSPLVRSNSQLPAKDIDLSGIDLKVVVLGDGASLPKEWDLLIKNSGAASIEVVVETLPASLVR